MSIAPLNRVARGHQEKLVLIFMELFLSSMSGLERSTASADPALKVTRVTISTGPRPAGR
jgi:hypothetical protein